MPKTQPTYDGEFRRNAVEMLLNSDRPLNRVAGELGICPNSLRGWRNRMLGKGRVAQAWETKPSNRSAVLLAEHPVAERRRLQRENEYLRRQRDILKKAVSILSEDPQSGMR